MVGVGNELPSQVVINDPPLYGKRKPACGSVFHLIYRGARKHRGAHVQNLTFATSEHMPWREVAETYAKLGGLKYITVPEEDYLELISPKAEGWQHYPRQQLRYDRCFHRVVDNSKILSLMGETQKDLTPLAEGLRRELAGVTLDTIPSDPIINARTDGYLLAKGLK